LHDNKGREKTVGFSLTVRHVT